MGVCRPFSDIDLYLQEIADQRVCLVDTNFLIAVADKEHQFHADAQFLHEKLSEYSVSVMVSVSARTEYIDYQRRAITTTALMKMLSPNSKWKISAAVRDILGKQRSWLNNQTRFDDSPYLTDARIKICRQTFSPKNHSGQMGWLKFCEEYLNGELEKAWHEVVELLPLNYVDMRSEDSKEFFRKKLDWTEMYRVSEKTAIGSQDAMILNLLDASVFPFVVTMDYDMAYGVTYCTQDKVALIPDNLYRNYFKKMKS